MLYISNNKCIRCHSLFSGSLNDIPLLLFSGLIYAVNC
ncbi:hypothetical protein T03_6499 [Trichinella britovi]|uniref:Uncharacterized protein n=1 Tax=Trichinella britovi TaxID=45882 RepID=A0A0V0YW61_TRIBR|nr:hypothetical protein T03_6499 [Trichinella britovi]